MGKTKADAKEYARLLYLDTTQSLTIREIVTRVGVRPATVSAWIKKERWDKLRKSLLVTRKKVISQLYDQLEWLNNKINSRENKVADPKETQTIAVITASIKKLETETSIAEIVEVATEFLEFIKNDYPELHKKLIPHFDRFIKSKMDD